MRATTTGKRRATRLGLAGALLLASLAVVVRLASAHHPEMTASATCGASGPVVRWTAVAWQTATANRRVNHDVRVQAFVGGVWQEIADGAFDSSNNYQFTGNYELPAAVTDVLYLKVVAMVRWGAAEDLGTPGEFRQTSVTLPTNCGGGGSGEACGGSLGEAADHNLFVRGNVSLANSDIGGRAAIGGDATFASYGIGSDISASSARVDLAVDGTLTVTNGVTVGSGSVTYGNELIGTVTTPQGVVTKARAPFVAATFADLYGGAAAWAGVTANGTVQWSTGTPRTLTLVGADPTLNVWTLRASDLQSAQQIRVNAPAASSMLVNVTGAAYDTNQAGLTSISFWNGTGYAQYGYPSSDSVAVAYRTHLLWNFAEAATVQIGPGLAWEGTVFAPYATVKLPGGAALNGGLIAANASMGTGAIATELHPYSANLPCLPPGGVPTGGTTTTTTTTTPTGGGDPTSPPSPPTTISPYCITYGNLSGTVFEDHNANGRLDAGGTATAGDRGVAGVTVRGYDGAGAVVGVVTSAADGSWRMNILSSASRDLRVEFSDLPAGYQPGSATTTGGRVQFVSMCDQGVDFAVQIPEHYCQDNPDLAATCQRKGASDKPVVLTQKWSGGWDARTSDYAPAAEQYNTGYPDAAGGTTAHPVSVPASAVGSVAGLAWRPATRTLYTAAFVKATAVLGSGGPGAVYEVPLSTNGTGLTPSVAVVLPAAAGGTVPLGSDGAPEPSGFDLAGRTGLGGAVIVSDRTDPALDALYVVGLADRRLYRVTNLDATAKTVAAIDMPLSLPGAAQGCAAADVRPFALTAWNGVVYAGLTCTAESTQDAAQVRAYVYAWSPAGGWAGAPALELALTYDRGELNYFGGTHDASQFWRPWNTNPDVAPGQALLTDLAVTEGAGRAEGDLVVGLRSRTGDKVTASSDSYWSASDVLLARRSGPGWVPEPGLSPTAHSEHFLNDGYPFSVVEGGDVHGHYEATRGAVAAVPGFANVAVSQLTQWWTSGIAWHTLASGRIDRALSLFNDQDGSTDTFGKTNSLGDLVALCDQAPIEVGDRVWADADDDGIQDVGEFGLPGVRVELRATNGTLIASTVTDGLGQYVFRGLLPSSAYQIWVNLTQPTLAAKGYGEAKVAQGGNGELDNNAVRSGDNVVAALDTGAPGDNDHSLDVGLYGPPGVRPQCSCATTTTTIADEPLEPPPSRPTYVSP